MRSYSRANDEARPITMQTGLAENADGSVLICIGKTKVLCTANLDEKVPHFLKNRGLGWLTAEYGMLPGSTNSRSNREAVRGKQTGRTVEIQRLIGRSLRMCVDMKIMGERTITVDCDVLNADGGTRTTAITGGWVATVMCLWKHRNRFSAIPLVGGVMALSVGIRNAEVMVDLDYSEDSKTDVDMNLVCTHNNEFVEVQGTGENAAFSKGQLDAMIQACQGGFERIKQQQIQMLLDQGVDQKWLS